MNTLVALSREEAERLIKCNEKNFGAKDMAAKMSHYNPLTEEEYDGISRSGVRVFREGKPAQDMLNDAEKVDRRTDGVVQAGQPRTYSELLQADDKSGGCD